MKNLTSQFLAETQSSIARAISIADVTRIAHLRRVPGGYHVSRPSVAFTAEDRAWFRRPVCALKGIVR